MVAFLSILVFAPFAHGAFNTNEHFFSSVVHIGMFKGVILTFCSTLSLILANLVPLGFWVYFVVTTVKGLRRWPLTRNSDGTGPISQPEKTFLCGPEMETCLKSMFQFHVLLRLSIGRFINHQSQESIPPRGPLEI